MTIESTPTHPTPAERELALRETLKVIPSDTLRTEEDELIAQLHAVQEKLKHYLIERLCRDILLLKPAATAAIFYCSEQGDFFDCMPDIQVGNERSRWYETADRARERDAAPGEGLLQEGFDESDMRDMRDLSDDFGPVGATTELIIEIAARMVTEKH